MGVVLAWSSGYPTTVDTVATNFPTVTDGTHDVLASHVNSLASAVVALQNAIGGFRTTAVVDPLSPNDGNVLTYDQDNNRWEAAPTAAGLVVTPLKAANYTANASELVFYDGTATAFQIDAPASPSTGQIFGIKETQQGTNNITLDGNGNNIENPNTSTYVANFINSTAQISLTYYFDGTQWVLV